MAQAAVLFVLGAILTAAFVFFGIQSNTAGADEELDEYHYDMLAREMAQTGLQLVVRKLADSYQMDSWDNNGFNVPTTTYAGGSFRADVTQHNDSGDTVNVVARGRFGPSRAVLYARYARAKDDQGIPPAFRNVISTDLNIRISGNLLVRTIDNSYNASIHTNDVLTTQGGSFLVEGYGTYTLGVNMTGQGENRFKPWIEYSPPPFHYQVDEITLPAINQDNLLELSGKQGSFINGPINVGTGNATTVIDFTDPNSINSVLGATYNCIHPQCGTEDHPFVLYVNSLASFEGTIIVEGYGTIYSPEGVIVQSGGSGSGIYGSVSEDATTKVLLATKGDISMGNNMCLGLGPSAYSRNDINAGNWQNNSCVSDTGDFSHGISLFAEGDVIAPGGPFLVGGIVSNESSFEGGGNPWITYSSPTESVIKTGFEHIVPVGPILIAYSEW